MKFPRARLSIAFSVSAASLVILLGAARAERLQPQVLIEPKFVEISDKSVRELGVNTLLAGKLAKLPPEWSNLFSSGATNFGLGPAPSAETIGARLFPSTGDEPGTIKLYGLVTDAQLQTILNTLGQQKSAKIISAPSIRVQSGQPANIQIPSFAGFPGRRIEVVPRIAEDGQVETALTVLQSAKLTEETGGKMPAIRDIPVLGALFRKTASDKQNLIIFVKPRIVDVLEPSSGDGGGGSTVQVETVGTGHTIGHIADLKIQNLTDQRLVFIIPPIVLESKSGKNQDYACPNEEDVSLAAHETKTIPVDGVCLNRNKPPVGKGVAGDLVINTANPNVPQNPDSHIPANRAGDLLRICTAKYKAADKLQKDGTLKDFPYKDKQKQKDIIVQWSTWCDPRISENTGAPLATKDDLKKVVYKQVEAKGKMSPQTKKKVDQGIDTIFEKVELTTAKAKDLEKPGPFFTGGASPGEKPGPLLQPATVAQPGDVVHVEEAPVGAKGHWMVKVKLGNKIVDVWFETDDKPLLEYCNWIKINKTGTSASGKAVIKAYEKTTVPTPTAAPAPTPTSTATPNYKSFLWTPAPTPTSTATPKYKSFLWTPEPTPIATQPPQSPGEKTEPEKPKTEAATPTPWWTPPDLPDWLKPWWQAVQYVVTGSEFANLPSGKDTLGGIIARVNKKITEECAKAGREKECEFYEELRDKLTKVYNNL